MTIGTYFKSSPFSLFGIKITLHAMAALGSLILLPLLTTEASADALTLTCDVDWKSIVVVAKARSVTPLPEQITITIDGNKATITKSDGHLIAEVPAAWHDQDISLGNPSPAVWGSFEHNINGLSGRITEFAKTEELDRLVMQTMDGYCLKLDAKRIS